MVKIQRVLDSKGEYHIDFKLTCDNCGYLFTRPPIGSVISAEYMFCDETCCQEYFVSGYSDG